MWKNDLNTFLTEANHGKYDILTCPQALLQKPMQASPDSQPGCFSSLHRPAFHLSLGTAGGSSMDLIYSLHCPLVLSTPLHISKQDLSCELYGSLLAPNPS